MNRFAIVAATTALLGATGLAGADGQATYKRVCFACHDFGAAGAPKLTEKEKWAPRLAKGVDALLVSVTEGLNAMPPRGHPRRAIPPSGHRASKKASIPWSLR